MNRLFLNVSIGMLTLVLLSVLAGTAVSDSQPSLAECESDSFDEQQAIRGQQTPDRITLEIIPEETAVPTTNTTIFIVCVVNPQENKYSFYVKLKIWHSQNSNGQGPTMEVSYREVEASSRTNTVNSRMLNQSMHGGLGRRVIAGVLHPGDAAQYPVLVTNTSPIGKYQLNAMTIAFKSSYPNFSIRKRQASLEITPPSTPPCGIGCEIGTLFVTIVKFIYDAPNVVSVIVASLSLLVYLFGPENIRSKIQHLGSRTRRIVSSDSVQSSDQTNQDE